MHPHRSSALGYASAASAAHSRVYGACAAEAAASETSGLSVGGCIRARGYFGPHPVDKRSVGGLGVFMWGLSKRYSTVYGGRGGRGVLY